MEVIRTIYVHSSTDLKLVCHPPFKLVMETETMKRMNKSRKDVTKSR